MAEDAITTALSEFGRQRHLPPLAWVILGEGSSTEIQGYGSEETVNRWVDALDFDDEKSRVGKHRWSGDLGEWKLSLLAA